MTTKAPKQREVLIFERVDLWDKVDANTQQQKLKSSSDLSTLFVSDTFQKVSVQKVSVKENLLQKSMI